MADQSVLPPAWQSAIYPRFSLTQDEITRLMDRFLEPGILTKEDLNHELHKAQCWLRDYPAKAARKRAWYKFFRNWLSLAEDNKRGRIGRQSDGRHQASAFDRSNRRRALGLEEEDAGEA
jgi:hypothetical protein